MEALRFPTAVWRRVWRDAAIVVAVAICLARATGLAWTSAADFNGYYYADLGQLYAGSFPGGPAAYLYSPIFALVFEPLRWLPYGVALGLWTGLELAALIYVAGPWSLLLLFPLAPEWINGNVHIVMAAAIFAGLRRASPFTWAVPAFTKLAPAVGLAWYAFRGEWRTLGRGLAVVGVLWSASLVFAPDLWLAWGSMLLANVEAPGLSGSIDLPLLARIPVALALLAWGARGNRFWTVPVACALAMPTLWISATFAFGIVAIRLAAVPNPAAQLGRLVSRSRSEPVSAFTPSPAVVPIEV